MGLQVGLLAPRRPAPHEHIRRAGIGDELVGRAVHARRAAVLIVGPDDHRVAGHRNRNAEIIAYRDLVGLEVGLLGDGVDGERVARAALLHEEADGGLRVGR